jgi:hypothetical protein
MRSTPRVPARARFRRLVGITLLALLAVGCQNKGDVSGRVTFKDKPLVYGTVSFETTEGPSVQAVIKQDGSYVAHGVGLGEARVTVNSADPKQVGSMLSWKNPAAKPQALNIQGWFPIPEKFASTGTSGLTKTVKRGDNKYDIDLK